jgi:hypothetical protein
VVQIVEKDQVNSGLDQSIWDSKLLGPGPPRYCCYHIGTVVQHWPMSLFPEIWLFHLLCLFGSEFFHAVTSNHISSLLRDV